MTVVGESLGDLVCGVTALRTGSATAQRDWTKTMFPSIRVCGPREGERRHELGKIYVQCRDLRTYLAEHNTLPDGQAVIQVAKRLILRLVSFHVEMELLDRLDGDLFFAEEDLVRLGRKALREILHLVGEGSGEQHDLDVVRQHSAPYQLYSLKQR